MLGIICAVKRVVTKQVSLGHVYVQSCAMPSESHSILYLLLLNVIIIDCYYMCPASVYGVLM